MSFGQLNRQIAIARKGFTQDEEGFKTESLLTIATVRAYREGRHGSEKWANRATFSDATELFRFRIIPGTEITKDLVIRDGEEVFEITSVEDVKGKGMYLEVLCKAVEVSG